MTVGVYFPNVTDALVGFPVRVGSNKQNLPSVRGKLWITDLRDVDDIDQRHGTLRQSHTCTRRQNKNVTKERFQHRRSFLSILVIDLNFSFPPPEVAEIVPIQPISQPIGSLKV
jgi:hypothetical protein